VTVLAQSFEITFIENPNPLPFNDTAFKASAVVGSKVYFFGGLRTITGTNSSYSYDASTDEWEELAGYPRPIYGGCAATNGIDTIWVFGKVFYISKCRP
jgi:N-acetylneuraminic acid mutarotase